MTPKEHAAYIAAFIDGEGHIGNHPMKCGSRSKSISFCNTEKALIDAMLESFNVLGIKTRIHYAEPAKKHWSPRWTVYVAGGEQSFAKFAELVPLRSEKKKLALQNLLQDYENVRNSKLQKKQANVEYCEQCNKPFYTTKSFKNRGGGRFCSVKCRGLSQRSRVTLSCKVCSTLFEVNKSRADKAQFCSQSCFGKSKADILRQQAKKAAETRWKNHVKKT